MIEKRAPLNIEDANDLQEIFSHHPATDEQQIAYGEIRVQALDLVGAIVANCHPCADRTAAIRKVREAVMTANAAVALRGGI